MTGNLRRSLVGLHGKTGELLRNLRQRAGFLFGMPNLPTEMPDKFLFSIQGMLRPSVRYELRDQHLIIRTAGESGEPDRMQLTTPTVRQWKEFRERLWANEISIWLWEPRYGRSTGGMYWRLELSYADQEIRSEGSKTHASFYRLLAAVEFLARGDG